MGKESEVKDVEFLDSMYGESRYVGKGRDFDENVNGTEKERAKKIMTVTFVGALHWQDMKL